MTTHLLILTVYILVSFITVTDAKKCKLMARRGTYSFVCGSATTVDDGDGTVAIPKVSQNQAHHPKSSLAVPKNNNKKNKRKRRNRLKLKCERIEGEWFSSNDILMKLQSLLSILCPKNMVLQGTQLVTKSNKTQMTYQCCHIYA